MYTLGFCGIVDIQGHEIMFLTHEKISKRQVCCSAFEISTKGQNHAGKFLQPLEDLPIILSLAYP